jgi:branched-chain amino acid transport system permease protein
MSSRLPFLVGLALAVVALGVILVADDAYLLRIATLGAIFAILALGLNLTAGHLGLFDFGYVLYFGVGGYTTAILTLRNGWSWQASLPPAIIAAGVAGLLVGVIVLRLRGPYFVIATFSFLTVAYYLAINWRDLTNGPLGLIGLPVTTFTLPGIGRIDGLEPRSALGIALAGLVVAAVVVRRLTATSIGRAWHAIRSNEDLAASIGVDATRHAFVALVVSAALGGLAGSIYAQYIGIVTPEIFAFGHMVNVLLMVVIGGTGTFVGPIVGAFLVESIPEFLRVAEQFRLPLFGLILIATILFAPRGIVSLRPRIRRRRRGAATMLAEEPGHE